MTRTKVFRWFLKLVYGLSSVMLIGAVGNYAANNQFYALGVLVLSPIALLIGISGLLYNRTRAIDSRKQRYRSLYSAERALNASILYILALVWGFLVSVIGGFLEIVEFVLHKHVVLLLHFPTLMLCLFSFEEISCAISAVFKDRFPIGNVKTARKVAALLKS